jgi:hypothetical protein
VNLGTRGNCIDILVMERPSHVELSMTDERAKATARTLLELALEHHQVCPGERCVIALETLRSLYVGVVARELTELETAAFR